MRQKIKYWVQVFILGLGLPVLIELVFRILRIKNLFNDTLGVIEFTYIIVVLPVYLVWVYKYFNEKFATENLNRVFAMVILSCFFLCSLIDYLNWSDITKKYLDAESRDVTELGMIFQFLLGLFFTVAASIIVYYKKKTNANI